LTFAQAKQIKLPGWLQKFVATMGSGGLFAVSFLDSSVLSFPFVTDALVVDLSVQHPSRMPLYATMAVAGSRAGCIWLFYLAKKGGEAYFRRHAGVHAERTKRWVDRNAFVTMFISSILPPPLPLFKIVVLAEGVFQVELHTFALALLCGRGVRFFAEGILAVHYGPAVLVFLETHKLAFAIGGAVALLGLWLASKFFLKEVEEGKA
jgi:membrane protein YqaA with SNARE-associated domain